jgi:protein-S-isoprenylcysteine O-methyltransferase Ste14
MDLNRNQFFMAGLIVFLLGVQLRMVEAFVLNERATQFVAQRNAQLKGNQVASAGDLPTLFAAQSPVAKKRIEPPRWIGWAMVSVGTVLILHSLAMRKPGGS